MRPFQGYIRAFMVFARAARPLYDAQSPAALFWTARGLKSMNRLPNGERSKPMRHDGQSWRDGWAAGGGVQGRQDPPQRPRRPRCRTQYGPIELVFDQFAAFVCLLPVQKCTAIRLSYVPAPPANMRTSSHMKLVSALCCAQQCLRIRL